MAFLETTSRKSTGKIYPMHLNVSQRSSSRLREFSSGVYLFIVPHRVDETLTKSGASFVRQVTFSSFYIHPGCIPFEWAWLSFRAAGVGIPRAQHEKSSQPPSPNAANAPHRPAQISHIVIDRESHADGSGPLAVGRCLAGGCFEHPSSNCSA